MNKCIILVFTAFFFLKTFSQKQPDTLRLFYSINETQSQINFAKLDSFVNRLQVKNVHVKLLGYADYLHNDDYNLALSQKRADILKSHLLKKHYSKITIIQCKGMGEKLSKPLESNVGEAYQRRVDVILIRSTSNNEVDTRPVLTVENGVKPVEELESENLQELEKGQRMILEGLSFIPGRHIIVKESKPILEKLLKTMKENPKLKIEIQGHVCCMDGELDGLDYDSRDRNLSENRAKAIYEYLIKNGINKNRLQYKGFGHSKPRVSPETTPEEEQMNRRVEVMVIEN